MLSIVTLERRDCVYIIRNGYQRRFGVDCAQLFITIGNNDEDPAAEKVVL